MSVPAFVCFDQIYMLLVIEFPAYKKDLMNWLPLQSEFLTGWIFLMGFGGYSDSTRHPSLSYAGADPVERGRESEQWPCSLPNPLKFTHNLYIPEVKGKLNIFT